MGVIFYLAGLGLAGFAGYSGFGWYFIFIASLIMAIGYFIIRAPQIHGAASNEGAVAVPKLLFIQIMGYAILTAPVYYIATLLR